MDIFARGCASALLFVAIYVRERGLFSMQEDTLTKCLRKARAARRLVIAVLLTTARHFETISVKHLTFSRVIMLLSALILAVQVDAQQTTAPEHLFFHVVLGAKIDHPISGRLLIFVQHGTGAKRVDVDQMSPNATYIAAKEIQGWKPGATIDIDVDDLAFPEPLSHASTGDYEAQAVLDIGHTYNYAGRQPGDLISDVVPLTAWNPGKDSGPTITLNGIQSAPTAVAAILKNEEAGFDAAIQLIDFVSPVLTTFWGRDIHMKCWVLLPAGYDAHKADHYPTVYFTHGFGGTLQSLHDRFAAMVYDHMLNKKMPEMIWVFLDESSPTGTHEFADSANNGPWGLALTTELVPHLETQYRMDAHSSGRFLQGHSSGGWATLWLQTNYPKIFGGTWSTSPDPSDFHAFSTIDLYAPHPNFYHDPGGSPVPIMRDHGQVRATMEQLAKQERVLGDYGGQLRSFEWVFSPRGTNGAPMPIFDRSTGEVDPLVASYWRNHYDIAHRVEENWSSLGPDLRGKINLVVGTADTFYLDGAAHKFEHVLDSLHAEPHFRYLTGKTHFDLYQAGDDRYALIDEIASEMYLVARPKH